MAIGKPNPYPGFTGDCPDRRAHLPKVSHDVTVRAGINYVSVLCSCGKGIMGGKWEMSFDEINAAVTRHYALETDDYPGLKSIFAHVQEMNQHEQ